MTAQLAGHAAAMGASLLPHELGVAVVIILVLSGSTFLLLCLTVWLLLRLDRRIRDGLLAARGPGPER